MQTEAKKSANSLVIVFVASIAAIGLAFWQLAT